MPRRRPTIREIRQHLRSSSVDARELRRFARDPRKGVRQLVHGARRRLRRAELEAQRLSALLRFERDLWAQGRDLVAGVDEAGSGPLAGPVVAAAVILPRDITIDGVDDSKKLSRKKRRRLEVEIRRRAVAVGVGMCSPAEIDRLNILQAGRQAMRRAVEALRRSPDHLLVDARIVPDIAVPQTTIVDGDALSQSIAAASIIAKEVRDRLMEDIARDHPGYGFQRHRGYATRAHLQALEKLGPCPVHRRSFAPVAEASRRMHPQRVMASRRFI